MDYATFVGLDVHKTTISAATFSLETGVVEHKKFGGDYEPVCTWIASLKGPVQVVYESGFSGFALYRILERKGIDCVVAAISKMQKPKGDRVKTDKRDAAFLARALACKNIPGVEVPTLEREGMRDLSRLRESLRDRLTAAKHRVSQMTLRYGYSYSGSSWTREHWVWLKALDFASKQARFVLDNYLEEVERLTDEKERITKRILALTKTDALKQDIETYSLIKGLGQVTAFCLVAEIGNLRRFASPGAFASYLGLVPSEYSSGQNVSRGKLTKTGNSHVRKSLIEAAWCLNRLSSLHREFPPDTDPVLAAFARQANRRLQMRRQSLLSKNNKKPCVANTAIARELACALWRLSNMRQRSAA